MKNAMIIATLGCLLVSGVSAQQKPAKFYSGVYASHELPRVQGLIDGMIARGGDRMEDLFGEIRKGDWGDAIEELLDGLRWDDQKLLLRYLPHAINHAEARLGYRGHSIAYPLTDQNGHLSPLDMARVRRAVDRACADREVVEEVQEALGERDWEDVAEDLMRGFGRRSAEQELVLRYFPYALRYLGQRFGNAYPISDPSFVSLLVPVR